MCVGGKPQTKQLKHTRNQRYASHMKF